MNGHANEIVIRVIRALDAAGVPHMLVGSLSSNSYGVERSTQDADFVIALGDRPIGPIADALGPDIHVDPQVSFESVTLTSRYEAVHVPSAFGIELFLLSDDPFHRERFARRRKVRFGPVEAHLPTAEDVVVQKLRWYGRVKRSKDLEDARDVVAVQSGRLDLAYARKWCDAHGTRELLERLLVETAGL